ncbi:hypothetical protein PQA73_gp52 [Erwinia phage Pavtok]|uniref:Uncharacterized protein n=1 Tax=Erwinia phage Pavtok TaxID=2267655 RepID=A0A345BM09_9CAUD|nr:hypothetical protein PQA73_gp52 [Erwinia phage Pavtok]AXF51480.1 hypothetical protein PAVTOK_52 [Erwinia phage Pavtok]
MTLDEQERTVQMLAATAEVMGTELKPSAAFIMTEDLAQYRFEDVARALSRVRREQSGRLTLKMVLDVLAPAGGWTSANEAWALALPALDEAATVVWTPEIAKAWAIARPIFEAGDKIGARMAFIPAYERLVELARNEGREPQFEVSAGWDPKLRVAAVEKARTIGLLPPARPEPVLALEGPKGEEFTPEQMEANRQRMATNMRKLADHMKEQGQKAEQERIEQRERERLAFEKRKADMVAEAEAHFAKDDKPDDAAPFQEAAE